MEVKKEDLRVPSIVIAKNAYLLSEFVKIMEQILLKEQDERFTKAKIFYFKCVASTSLGLYMVNDDDWNMFRKYLLYHNVQIYSCVPKEETTFVLKGFLDFYSTEEIQEELEKNSSIPILQYSVMKRTKIPTCLVETTSDVTAEQLKKVIPTIFRIETKWSKYVSRMRVLYCLDCHNWSCPPEDGFRRAQCLKCLDTPIIVDMNSVVNCEKCKNKHLGYTCPIEIESSEESEPSNSKSTSFNIASKNQFPKLTQNSEPESSFLNISDEFVAQTVEELIDVLKTYFQEKNQVASNEVQEKKPVQNKWKKRI